MHPATRELKPIESEAHRQASDKRSAYWSGSPQRVRVGIGLASTGDAGRGGSGNRFRSVARSGRYLGSSAPASARDDRTQQSSYTVHTYAGFLFVGGSSFGVLDIVAKRDDVSCRDAGAFDAG